MVVNCKSVSGLVEFAIDIGSVMLCQGAKCLVKDLLVSSFPTSWVSLPPYFVSSVAKKYDNKLQNVLWRCIGHPFTECGVYPCSITSAVILMKWHTVTIWWIWH